MHINRALFSILKKGQGTPPPSPLVACLPPLVRVKGHCLGQLTIFSAALKVSKNYMMVTSWKYNIFMVTFIVL